jgi:hypothetical protein
MASKELMKLKIIDNDNNRASNKKIRYSSKNPNYLTTLNLPYQCDYLGIKMLR